MASTCFDDLFLLFLLFLPFLLFLLRPIFRANAATLKPNIAPDPPLRSGGGPGWGILKPGWHPTRSSSGPYQRQ